MVRASRFKKWFGDWENANLSEFLNGNPVVELSGAEFQQDGVKLTEKVARWFEEEFSGVATHPIIGEVVMNEQSVRDSIAHGLGRNKAAAFAAVPSIITNGRILSYSQNWKTRNYDSYVVAAPITLGGKQFIETVIINRNVKQNRFYVYEEALKEKLRDAFKTGAFTNGRTTGAYGALSTINLLGEALNVNPSNVSKGVDENGEPLVVYHGTGRDFAEFDMDAKRGLME